METWKIGKLDLAAGLAEITQMDQEWSNLGGRAFTSQAVARFTPPVCPPLDPANTLALAVGLMANSKASSTYRISFGAKSPLTGGIKESNSGGVLGVALANLGLRGLIIQNAASQWTYLLINEDGISFHAADALMGKGIYETVEILRQVHGKKAAMAAIGPAGEQLLPVACIGITDIDGVPARHAARGGLGAVMGSKRLKAIVIEPSAHLPQPADPSALAIAKKRFNDALLNHPTTNEVLRKYGTAFIVDVTNRIGALPTRNYSAGQFEGAESINGETLYQMITDRKGKPIHACMPGCVVCCSNVIPDKDGKELNRALEYETIGLMGSNLGISDLDTICRLNKLCDDIGVDTIETGAALGVMMDQGILPFGDGKGALQLVQEITHHAHLGQLLGSGTTATGKALGAKRVPAVRGQSLAAYDPRALKGTGVTYASSPMGADHTAGNVLPGSKLPDGSAPDNTLPDRQIELSRYIQLVGTLFDCLGLCWLAKPPIFLDFTLVTDVLNALDGGGWDIEKIFKLAASTLDVELAFNKAAGVSQVNDLPEFFRTEKLPPFGYVFDVDSDAMQGIHQIGPQDL